MVTVRGRNGTSLARFRFHRLARIVIIIIIIIIVIIISSTIESRVCEGGRAGARVCEYFVFFYAVRLVVVIIIITTSRGARALLRRPRSLLTRLRF